MFRLCVYGLHWYSGHADIMARESDTDKHAIQIQTLMNNRSSSARLLSALLVPRRPMLLHSHPAQTALPTLPKPRIDETNLRFDSDPLANLIPTTTPVPLVPTTLPTTMRMVLPDTPIRVACPIFPIAERTALLCGRPTVAA